MSCGVRPQSRAPYPDCATVHWAGDDLGGPYLLAAVERQDVPEDPHARMAPDVAAAATRAHISLQTRGRLFSKTNDPAHLDAALKAYHEAVRIRRVLTLTFLLKQ